MIKVKDKKSNKIYKLLANVPTSFIWKLKVILTAPLWLLSKSDSKKSWNEFYYGLIKHDCDYDYTKLEGNKYKHYPCKHYGCNIVSVQDKNGNWLIINIIVNGVNLGLTFRNQFQALAKEHNENIDEVIKHWTSDANFN